MLIPEEFPILERQEARLERALAVFTPADQARIRNAFALARASHAGQLRQGVGEVPFIIHPIRVACSLVDEFALRDVDAVIAALLHDVVEDTGVALDELERRFGATVRRAVAALTWPPGPRGRKWAFAEAMRRQPRMVRLVKAADIIDNSRATWQVTDQTKLLPMLYGYATWGRRIVESVGAPATLFLDAALQKSTSIHAPTETPPLPPNPGKALSIDIPDVARYPIRTHVVASSDDLLAVVRRYAVPYLAPRDLLAISERIVAITQGRAYPIRDIRPSRWATFLVRFVTKSPYGIGLGSPWTMELAIREAGILRVLLAAFVAAVTKPFGLRGMFYRVAGHSLNAIDGPCDYTLPVAFSPPLGRGSERGSPERYAKLGPKDPDAVANRIAREVGVDTAIVDANDLGVTVLGASDGVDRAFVRAAFRDNPLGQSTEQTPMAIVRAVSMGRGADDETVEK